MSEAKDGRFDVAALRQRLERLDAQLNESELRAKSLEDKLKEANEINRVLAAGADGSWPQKRIEGVLLACDKDGPYGAILALIGRQMVSVREQMADPSRTDAELREIVGGLNVLEGVREAMIRLRMPYS